MQDLVYLVSSGHYEEKYGAYPKLGNNMSKKYESAKISFIKSSGNLSYEEKNGDKVPIISGMAHPHLPQTYYLIEK
ncbi:MAG: hypothetical protein L0I51_05110 [Lactococcus plantarum]|nr:hypothetical protein [Lactococcus plantarum]